MPPIIIQTHLHQDPTNNHFDVIVDSIMDSTTHSCDESAMDSSDSIRTTVEDHVTSSTLEDQRMNSPSWRKDPLIGLGGPMTRSRAKNTKEALHGLVRAIHRDVKPRVENKPNNFITLLKVIED